MARNYYIMMDGVKYDRKMVECASGASAESDDGRISIAQAKQLLAAIMDANQYTEVEKETMKFIREKYSFTEAADAWIRTEIRRWAAARA